MSITGSIFKNIFSCWIYYFIQLLVGFFLTPFMVHRLGNELYGVWILTLTMSGYMGILDFGIRGSVVKYVAEFEAKKDFKTLNSVINSSLFIHLIAGLLTIIITLVASNFLSYFFKIRPEFIQDFKLCFIIVGFNLSISLTLSIFGGILEGHKRVDIVSGIELFSFILQSSTIAFCVLNGYGIVVLALSIFIISIFKHIIRFAAVYRLCGYLKLRLYLVNKKTLKLIFSYSSLLFIFNSLRGFISSLPNIILGIFLGPIAITFYSIASRLVGYCITFLFTASTIFVPFISSFEASNDIERLSKSFTKGSKYTYMIMLFLVTILLFMGAPFIRLWMGEQFVKESYGILFILSIIFVLCPSYFIIESLLKGLGRLKEICFLVIIEMIFGIILSTILVKRYGAIGVAIGLSLPQVINYGIILLIFVSNIFKINFREYIRETIAPLLFPTIALVCTLLLFKSRLYPNNYLLLFVEFLLSGLLYFGLCFKFTLSPYERDFYLSKLRLFSGKR